MIVNVDLRDRCNLDTYLGNMCVSQQKRDGVILEVHQTIAICLLLYIMDTN